MQGLDLSLRDRAARVPYGHVRIVSVLQVAVACLAVGQLGRVPLVATDFKEAPVLLSDLMLMVLFAAAAVVMMERRSLRLDSTAGFALAFAAIGGVSAVLAVPRFGITPFELAFSLAYLARWLVYFGLYVVVLNCVRTTDAVPVFRTFQNTVLAFTIFGIFQSAFIPNFAQFVHPDAMLYRDWDPQGHRLVSSMLDPNYAGALIVVALLPSLALLSYGVRVPAWKLGILLMGLLLTVSRGALLSFVVGGCVLLAGRGLSRRLLRLGGAMVLLSLPALPAAIDFAMRYDKFYIDKSALIRVTGWLRAIEFVYENPLIGVGFNTFGFVMKRVTGGDLGQAAFGVDGGLLLIAALTGLVGLSFYLAMIVSVLRRARQVWRNPDATPDERGIALGTAAATTAFVFHGFFLNTLLYPFLVLPIWLLWALTRVCARRVAQAGAEGAAPARPPALVQMAAGGGA